MIGLVGLVVALLAWNFWNIQTLEARLAILEAAPAARGESRTSTTVVARRESSVPRRVEVLPPGSTVRSEAPDGRIGAGASAAEVALLGLDDPDVKAAFDSYLESFIEEHQDARSELEESNYLDHMSTTVEVYCEELNLSAEVQERIVLRIENAHEGWVGAELAHESGEIDRREMLEIHGKIEDAVRTEMVELLGEESWEELAGRIWG